MDLLRSMSYASSRLFLIGQRQQRGKRVLQFQPPVVLREQIDTGDDPERVIDWTLASDRESELQTGQAETCEAHAYQA